MLDDRVLLVAVYYRTNLTLRQVTLVFDVSKSAAGRVVERPRLSHAQHQYLIITAIHQRDGNCASNGVSGPTRRAEVRRDGHCE
ncbi:transposase family protein [Saccharopolyspora shandongensis]|uniref:transposase family protein n=1 Tax=Saccharopolyspora shandongensis TaxID=418495 RepID=UPI0033CA33F9